ncbi:hypothetical protein ACIHFD_66715 [Nonomuraea sp. NPDC051941]|uniref:hypothetical protein n=1 Tax=Nonomuraea sp. NPDC051941 TaxID=3364373 RepID=UPI0037C80BDC
MPACKQRYWKSWPAGEMVLVLMLFAVVLEFQGADPLPVSQPPLSGCTACLL